MGLALVALVLVLYWQVAGHEFVNLDDQDYIVANPRVRQGLTWDGIGWAFASFHSANWHPLTWLSHMLDCQLFGLAPRGHHITNVVLHAANALLLFLSLRFMTSAVWPSAFVAALFAVHPLRAESVAWVSERKDVLSGLFWMLTILAYAWYVKRPATRRYLLVFTSLALGLMAKPMLVTLPAVLLLLDLWPLGRLRLPGFADRGDTYGAELPALAPATRPTHRLIVEKLPLLCLSVASSVVTVLAQQSGGTVGTLEAVPAWSRLANVLMTYVTYLWKTIWPTDLAVTYPHPALVNPEGSAALTGAAIAAALLLLSISVAVVALARRRPYLAVGWLWYLGTLLPVIGLFQVGSQAMADRYTYVPLVGIYILIAWGVRDLTAHWSVSPRVLTAVTALLLGGYMTATWFQVGTWRNSFTLFEHAIRVTSDNWVAHSNLATVLMEEGRLAEAAAHLERALHIMPGYAAGHTKLGIVFERQGKLAEAAAQHERAVRLNPDVAEAHSNLGAVFFKQGKLAQAATRLERALQINPELAEAHTNLGAVFVKQGQLARAAAQFEHALRIEPDHAPAHSNLGVVFLNQGRLAQAAAQLERALQIQPDLANAHTNLGIVLTRRGRLAEAATHFERALQINPDDANARQRLDSVLSRLQARQ
jgi:Tfp pilus assembly protein PilF